MSVQEIDAVTTLSTAMRVGSMAAHEAAEGSPFIEELMAGKLNEAGYTAYLQRLRPVYAALEKASRSLAADPLLSKVHDSNLERLEAIDADLDFWAPGQAKGSDSAATQAYVDRITAATQWGGLLVAHHYTRYLGDLSGGLAIGKLLDRHYGLEGKGLAFYTFATIEKPKLYKDDYRAALDAVGDELNAEETARVVEEVQAAFHLNQGLFNDLGQKLDEYRR